MELIAGYLCDKLKDFAKLEVNHLVLKLKGIWDRIPKTLIWGLVVSILANAIYDIAKSLIISLIIK